MHIQANKDTTDKFEMVVFSLMQLYDLPEWVQESAFWVEDYKEDRDVIQFDIGC